ncbi:MAG: isochorismatase family protein [Acidimicrobiales bacterium]
MDLAELVNPRHTAIVCMEMERGVVGDLCLVPGLEDAVRESGIVDRLRTLFAAARGAGIRVIHCTAAFRPDRVGSYRNMPTVNRFLENPEHLLVGAPTTQILPELHDESDIESLRFHGIAPFIGTSLDPTLRSLGARTVIAAGVSLNRGIMGISIEGVDHGYSVVVPRDGVAGYPADYGEMVLKHSLDGLTTLTTVAELVEIWSAR